MFVSVALDHLARRLQLNSTSMHVCYSCIYQQMCLNKLQLTNNHTCCCVAIPAGIYVTFCLRPAVMSLCSYPTNKLVSTITPDHHACILQLRLTSSHILISCILSACMSCYSFILPGSMYIAFAPDHQPCLY